MDTSLDNNNPFANSNGADNSIITAAAQKTTTTTDALLLNLSENYKHNGGAAAGDFYHNSEKANGKRLASEFLDDDDDLGPETDVDAVDDVLSPSIMQAKALADGIVNNNPDGSFNPFVEKDEVEKAALEIDLDLQKQQSSEFDGQRSPREETPTPPADAVHDGGLEENVGDSGGEESEEDEWNYIKGEEANKENISPSQPDCEVADLLEEADNMSQLNPNAAEFVPVSPTRSIPSPACRAMLNDPVIAQSPKRPSDIDISLPNPQEFESEVKSRPSDFDSYSNGHDHEGDENDKPTSQELMENLLNGKNIDEIPEFQPTPTKAVSEEFHFGPNAAPFTPAKPLDQSEAALSTKAVYGDDESALTFDSTFDTSKDNVDFLLGSTKKEEDPMSMSFYQEKADDGEGGGDAIESFDLNKVQMLPENLDDFLSKTEEQLSTTNVQDETISNLTETSEQELSEKSPQDETQLVSDEVLLNNDERIQTTDLDKMVDEEKELASPVSNEDDLISGVCEFSSRSPHPEIVSESPLPQQKEPETESELIEVCSRPESKSPLPELVCSRPESKSPFEELSMKVESSEILEVASSEPAVVSPEPAAVSPEPAVVSPEPTVLSPEPAVVSPDSAVLSPEPAVLASEPAVLSPEPAVVSPVESAPEVASSPEPVQHLEPEVCIQPHSEETASPEPEERLPEPGVCSPVASPVEEARGEVLSPELKITSPEPRAESPLAQVSSPEPSEELCQISSEAKSPQPPVEDDVQVKSPEPEKIEVEEELMCKLEAKETSASIESPVEDVTSSVKDVASPVESPIPDQVVASEQEVHVESSIPPVVVEEASSPVKDDTLTPGAPIEATPKSIADTESVLTSEMNSFLERSQLSDLTSPLSPGDQQQQMMDPDHPLMRCVYPLPTTEIKTETIAPEFAEPATVLSPIEPSKEEETPSVPSAPEESAKEPEKSVVEPETAAAAAVAAAATAVAAAAVVAEKKTTKTPTAKKPPAKTASPTKSPAAAKTRTAPTAAARTRPTSAAAPAAAKKTTLTASRTAPAAPKPAAPKPKTAAAASKPPEKKPLTNGELKVPRTSLTARKSSDSSKTPTTAKSPASATSKTSPTKPTAPRPTTAPAKPPATKTTTSTVAKTRPSTLMKTTSSSATTKTTTTASQRLTARTSTISPKPTSPPKPRPATAPARPKAPLTKTVSKTSTDTEKQIKDSANKLTASRTVTASKSTAASRTVTSTTVRKTEVKTTGSSRTTMTKTTTTGSTSTRPGKKPAEITRTATNKTTKITKTEKPVENGVVTSTTEQIMLNNTVNERDQQQLMKDNSPIDNKLIVETNTAD